MSVFLISVTFSDQQNEDHDQDMSQTFTKHLQKAPHPSAVKHSDQGQISVVVFF